MLNNNSVLQEISELRTQNDQLKSKYKKALQELMHILKINKSLKEQMDERQVSPRRDDRKELDIYRQERQIQKQSYILQIKQVNQAKTEVEGRLRVLELKARALEEDRDRYKVELSQSVKKLKEWETKQADRRRQQQYAYPKKLKLQQQLTLIKHQNQNLNKIVYKLQGFSKQRQQLVQQIQRLKQQLQVNSQRLYEQRQRWRYQKQQLQNQYYKYRSDQTAKLRSMQSKCQILEIQLGNYKNIQRYIEKESIQVADDQKLFNSIRQQIQKASDDLNQYDHTNQDLIANYKQEEAAKIKIIAELQAQIERRKTEKQQYIKKNQSLENTVKQMKKITEKVHFLQTQNKQLLERNNVFQALTITQKHRNGVQVSERIQQFQRKVQLLLQENGKSISGMGGLQQIIILKSYIRQLSELLSNYKKREQKLIKKYQALKQHQKEAQKNNKIKIDQYKKKMVHYDSLVGRLYSLLQQKVMQKPTNMQKQKDISEAISKYQQKMLNMSDEIIKLRRKKDQIQEQHRSKGHSNIGQQQRQKLKATISKLQLNLQGLQNQSKSILAQKQSLALALQQKINQAKQLINQKDLVIEGLTEQIRKLQGQAKVHEQKQQQLIQIMDAYQKQVNGLHAEIEEKVKTNNYLIKKDKDSASLIDQVTKLQGELSQLKASQGSIIEQSNKSIQQHLNQLKHTVNLQVQQIEANKQQNENLYQQLQQQKREKQELIQQKQSMNIRLQTRIAQLQKQKREQVASMADLHSNYVECKRNNQSLNKENLALLSQIDDLQKQLSKKQQFDARQRLSMKSEKDIINQIQEVSNQVIHRTSKQTKDLNAVILTLRTESLALKNQLQEKDATISELKHQIYNMQLKMQRQKSKGNLLTAKQLPSSQQSQQYQRLQKAYTVLQVQVQSLRQSKNKYTQSQKSQQSSPGITKSVYGNSAAKQGDSKPVQSIQQKPSQNIVTKKPEQMPQRLQASFINALLKQSTFIQNQKQEVILPTQPKKKLSRSQQIMPQPASPKIQIHPAPITTKNLTPTKQLTTLNEPSSAGSIRFIQLSSNRNIQSEPSHQLPGVVVRKI